MATYYEGREARRPAPILLGVVALAVLVLALAYHARQDSAPAVTPGAMPFEETRAPDTFAATMAAQARAAGLERAPRPLAGNPVPAYPRSALRNGHEGDVILNLVVGADGRVMDAQVVERAGTHDPAFDRAAIEAANQWRFEPALRDGEAAPATVRLPIEFRRS